jgi:hypothetical protein
MEEITSGLALQNAILMVVFSFPFKGVTRRQ